MNCPACGCANEEAAKACARCRKPLIPKADPVPSWPNRAILCLLFTPAALLLVAGLLLHREDDGMGPPGGPPSTTWLWLSGLGCVAATLPLAARLAYAPHLATATLVIVRVVDAIGNPGPTSRVSWITFGGIVLAWIGRSAFTREWDAAKVPGWTLQGYRRLLRDDRWAALRVIAGIVLFLGGIAFMMASGTAVSHVIPISRPVAKVLAIPAFIGAFLAGSGLSLSEAPELL